MMNFSDFRDAFLASTVAVLIVLAWVATLGDPPSSPPVSQTVTGGSQYQFEFVREDGPEEPWFWRKVDRLSGVTDRFDS